LNTFKSNLLRGTRMLREQLASRLEVDQAADAVGGGGRQPAPGGERVDGQRVGGFRDPAAAAPERVGGR
jgi:hypothetical protein